MRPSPEKTVVNASRERAMWAILSVLVLAQMVAFWMLCSQQVRKAEVRGVAVQAERSARIDCLRYLPDSTPATCSPRQAQQAASIDGAGAVAVNWVR